jgi:putative transposase
MRDIRPEVLDALLSGYEKPSDLLGEDGIFRQLKKRLLERALTAEMSEHVSYEKGERSGRRGTNNRKGHTTKTVLTDEGSVPLLAPRDRDGTFEPAIVPKGVTRLAGFEAQVISLYARGPSVRDVQAHLRQMYQVEVSPDLISRVTDAVHEDLLAWRNRPPNAVYLVVFLDALGMKIRHDRVVKNKAVYVALALTLSGEKEVLGLWVELTEGARFWLGVLNELKTHGVEDILIAVVDGLKGFPEAIRGGFPADDDADLHRA